MFWIILIIILSVIILFAYANYKVRKQWTENYFQFLDEKFGKDMSEMIKTHEPWISQSDEEFIAMYGKPNHIERVEMKTKTKLIFSYPTKNPSTNRETNNKYTFENNLLSKIEVKGPLSKVWKARNQINPFE